MKHWCAECFAPHARPTQVLTTESTSYGTCSFCSTRSAKVWEPAALRELLLRLLDQYEACQADEGAPLAKALQLDWELFAIKDADKQNELVQEALSGGDAPFELDSFIRLTRGAHSDQTGAWDRLTDELRTENRYFPQTAASLLPDLEITIRSSIKSFNAENEWFRARIAETPDGWPASEMSMPSRNRARAGRANSLGIPHLYVAREIETCIREARAVHHNFVTVATFAQNTTARILDLEEIYLPDPFTTDEAEGAQLLAATRMLRRLGEELRRPLRPTDHETEYVPTQYLSDFVKSLRTSDGSERLVDAVLYGSSLNPGGANAAFFSERKLSVRQDTVTYEITGMKLERQVATRAER